MKTRCEFCKTEYDLGSIPSGPVQCAVCGHIWHVSVPRRKNSFLIFIAAVCALLAAAVFTFVVMTRYKTENVKHHPLIAKISSINTTMDDNGIQHFIINGKIRNQSDGIYGMPDLILVAHDKNGRTISREKFMPSATLIDSGSVVTFSHILSVPIDGVKKITVELKK